MKKDTENNITLMSKVKDFLTNRYVLVFALLLFISVIIWFVGDAFAIYSFRPLESSFSKLALISLLFLVGVARELFRWYQTHKSNQVLLENISESDKDADSKASSEVQLLKKRMEEATELLKKQKFSDKKGKSQLVVELPWYMFIGAPGSGKTTALTNCGLKFPLVGRDGVLAIKGVGGTRNCDWWFTNEAVFLDTAGRYTTQDSNERADSKAWLGFLQLLKKSRPGTPLNGAIVTLSISDLLNYDASELKKYSASVRARINELYETLGVRFPIYLIVTKTDLLAGFTEFFSTFGQEERSQVWGFTFPYTKEESNQLLVNFDKEFKELEKNLYSRLVDHTLKDKDSESRSLVYNFPQQVSSTVPLIKQFIEHAFVASRFEDAPLLRGIYLTSGTQEGTPIDRVLGSLSRSLNVEQKILPPSSSSGKSYFLKGLLQSVVFSEAGLVGFDENRERQHKLVLKSGFISLAFASIFLISSWLISYFGNQSLIADVDQKAKAASVKFIPINNGNGDLLSVLDALNIVRDLPYGYKENDRGIPLWHRFGLSQADRLGEASLNSYQRAIGQTLLPRLAIELEHQIKNPADDQVLYEALKAYLMLYDDKHLDPGALEAWSTRLLPNTIEETTQNDLVGHIRAATERRPLFIDYPKNKVLIDDARQRLSNISLADRVYGRLKLTGDDGKPRPFRITDVAGPSASQVFTRASGEPLSAPIPAIFTKDGYYRNVKGSSEKLVSQLAQEEAWVLGKDESNRIDLTLNNTLTEEVRRKYFTEYIQVWDKLLLDIKVKRANSLSETIVQSRVLSSLDSPLSRLLKAVSAETTLAPKDISQSLAHAVTDVVKDTTNKIVSGITGKDTSKLTGIENHNPEQLVDEHYERLHQLVAAPQGQPAAIDQTILLLADFSKELAELESKVSTGSATLQGLPTAVRIKAEADTMPAPVQNILTSLINATTGLTAAANQEVLKKGAGNASDLCEKAVSGRYPFVKTSKNEVAIDDFNAVFKPSGDLDTFFKSNLVNLVDTSGAIWKVRDGSDKIAKVSNRMIQKFQSADVIRQSFFRGSQYAGFSADMLLTNPDVGQFTFEYDGEVYKLGPGQSNIIKIRWPGQHPVQPTLLRSGWGKEATALSYEGVWSLFRLLDNGSLESNKDKAKISIEVDGKKLMFDMRSTSIYNPLKLKEIQTFSCPGKD